MKTIKSIVAYLTLIQCLDEGPNRQVGVNAIEYTNQERLYEIDNEMNRVGRKGLYQRSGSGLFKPQPRPSENSVVTSYAPVKEPENEATPAPKKLEKKVKNFAAEPVASSETSPA